MARTIERFDIGTIEISRFNDILGNIERLEYKWVCGSKVSISKNLLYEMDIDRFLIGDVISFGPFKLKIVDEDIAWDTVQAIRIDYPFWFLVYIWHRYNKIFDLAYRRFIVTLAVWRLAEYDPAALPCWRDIYITQKLRRGS